MSVSSGTVFIVDDDASVRRGLTRLVKSAGLNAVALSSAREFLESELPEAPCCLVLDVRMPGLSGPDLQDEMQARGLDVPIIFITGHGNVPMSVRAMKAGAVDFLEKPFDDKILLETISRALEKHDRITATKAEVREIQQRIDTLTPREKEVLGFLITGMLNKQIAYELGITEKTIKVHRARVLSKTGVVSIAELVRLAGKAGIRPAEV
jgi:FixJ family two-component response regulator